MPRKETVAQRKTRISLLLADYDARNRELGKLNAIVKGLKGQIREIEPGTFGDFTLTYGTPRQLFDQQAARKLLTDLGVEVPMSETQPPIIVTPKVGK